MKTKNNKMIATAIAIILLVIAIIISLVFVFNNRHSAKAYNNKLDEAQRYVSKLDYKKAEAAYLKAIDIDPKHPTAYVELADVYVTINEQDKAEDILEKGYKNVDGKENKKIIKDKQEAITGDLNVTNNGGDYVTYRGKSYYWKYTKNSFYDSETLYVMPYTDAVNELVCVDNKGKEKTIYKGHGNNGIRIFNNKIYVLDTEANSYIAMDIDGTNRKSVNLNTIVDIADDKLIGFNKKGLVTINKNNEVKTILSVDSSKCQVDCIKDNRIYYSISDDDSKKINVESMDFNGKNKKHIITINKSKCEDSDSTSISRISLNCMQVMEKQVYICFTWVKSGNDDL